MPIVKQDPEILAVMQLEARIRAELPDIKLWSTKPKWELDVSDSPLAFDAGRVV